MAAFDLQRPPEQSVIDDCVHCGFCLDSCPTYVLWGAEADSPRGRIVLMAEGLSEGSTLSDEMVTHFDRCLGCMACVTACPSGVRYDRLIERVRPQVERHHERTRSERALRRLLYETLPHPQPPAGAGADARGGPQAGGRAAARAPVGARQARAADDGSDRQTVARAHPGRRGPARAGRAAARLRTARLLPRGPPRDDPTARRRGVRGASRRAPPTAAARSSSTAAPSRRRSSAPGARSRPSPGQQQRLRPHRRQRRRVRLGDEGVRRAARDPARHAHSRPASRTSPSCWHRSSRGRLAARCRSASPTTTPVTSPTRSASARSRGSCCEAIPALELRRGRDRARRLLRLGRDLQPRPARGSRRAGQAQGAQPARNRGADDRGRQPRLRGPARPASARAGSAGSRSTTRSSSCGARSAPRPPTSRASDARSRGALFPPGAGSYPSAR